MDITRSQLALNQNQRTGLEKSYPPVAIDWVWPIAGLALLQGLVPHIKIGILMPRSVGAIAIVQPWCVNRRHSFRIEVELRQETTFCAGR
jgi:hypothetical protein